MPAARNEQSEGLLATTLYTLAARTSVLNLTDDLTPPTRLQEGETSTGVVTLNS